MKTIREAITEGLTERGVWPKDVPTIIDRYLADPVGQSMRGRIDESADAYPAPLLAVVMMGVTGVAAEYVRETCPGAWFLPMLTA